MIPMASPDAVRVECPCCHLPGYLDYDPEPMVCPYCDVEAVLENGRMTERITYEPTAPGTGAKSRYLVHLAGELVGEVWQVPSGEWKAADWRTKAIFSGFKTRQEAAEAIPI